MQLSHTIALSEYCLAYLSRAFPQLKVAYALCTYSNGAFTVESLIPGKQKENHEQWMSFAENANSGWYAANETPLVKDEPIGQIGIEGELNRDHLFIKHLESTEMQCSLLLQFKPFVLSTKQYMQAAEKKVLEISIRSMLEQLFIQRDHDKQILKSLAENNAFQRNEISELQDKLDQRNRAFGSSLKQLLKLLLAELERKLAIEIDYDQSFIEGLGSFQGDFEELEKRLNRQVQLEANLAQLNDEQRLRLSKSHLKQLLKVKRKTEKRESSQLGRLSKASSLLDRYERAAESVRHAGLSIIGKNIGAHCNPPISNAAITDALSKNSKKIYSLFQQFPDRWPIIRSEFRSVSNIIEKESLRAKRVS